MKRSLALALALCAPLAWAQAPAQQSQKSQGSQTTRKAQKAKPPQKSHAKPTPAQIRRFNELHKQGGKP